MSVAFRASSPLGGPDVFIVRGLDLVLVTTSSTSASEERRSHRRTTFDVLEELIITNVARLEVATR